jgi:DNA-binding GntR family transcriptional regulator
MEQGNVETEPLSILVGRPPKLGDMVLDQVRNLIVSKRLQPGQRLSEAQVAGMLGVSKTPVREALLQLRMSGLIDVIDGNAHVVAPSAHLIREAYEVRSGLEALAARLAAERVDRERHAVIESLAQSSLVAAQQNDSDGFRQRDEEFHHEVALAAGNTILQVRITEALTLCQTLRQRDVLTAWDSELCGQAHVTVARVIGLGDSAAAASSMRLHIAYVMDAVLTAFSEQHSA